MRQDLALKIRFLFQSTLSLHLRLNKIKIILLVRTIIKMKISKTF